MAVTSSLGAFRFLSEAKSVRLHPSENDRQVKWKTCAWGKTEDSWQQHYSCILRSIQLKQEDTLHPQSGRAITTVSDLKPANGAITGRDVVKASFKSSRRETYSTVLLQQRPGWIAGCVGPHAWQLHEPTDHLSVSTSASAPPPAGRHVSVRHLPWPWILEVHWKVVLQ